MVKVTAKVPVYTKDSGMMWPGDTFDVPDPRAKEMARLGLIESGGGAKAEPPPENKAEAPPENKAEPIKRARRKADEE